MIEYQIFSFIADEVEEFSSIIGRLSFIFFYPNLFPGKIKSMFEMENCRDLYRVAVY